ncbi:MAG: peroxide stress protein YaaA [Coriobacteriaceae bacterium]|nr:MAG: peroxide stress protein YaaA [Coriobacteriaceae bacterium]
MRKNVRGSLWVLGRAPALACHIDLIVDLPSQEYSKAVWPFARKYGTPLIVCLFGEIRADGKFIQKATEAKAALGTFVWWCAENQIEDLKEFINFTERGYAIDHWRSMQHLLIFSRLSK